MENKLKPLILPLNMLHITPSAWQLCMVARHHRAKNAAGTAHAVAVFSVVPSFTAGGQNCTPLGMLCVAGGCESTTEELERYSCHTHCCCGQHGTADQTTGKRHKSLDKTPARILLANCATPQQCLSNELSITAATLRTQHVMRHTCTAHAAVFVTLTYLLAHTVCAVVDSSFSRCLLGVPNEHVGTCG